jgi:cytochrome c553
VGQAKDDAELLALGESLYRAGDLERGIPACTACHSVNGAGNDQAGFPRVSGQQKGYLITTLKEYRNLTRNAGDYSLVMQSASQNLKDSDIEALAITCTDSTNNEKKHNFILFFTAYYFYLCSCRI